jgi:streptogrisin B
MTKLVVLLALLFGSLTSAGTAVSAVGIACVSTRNCTPSHGGAYMVTTKNSCTAALPVRDRRTGLWYVLTAGHCIVGAKGATWRQSGLTLGVGTKWEYGGLGTQGRAGSTDAGLIRYTANGRLWNAASRVAVVGSTVRTQRITSVKAARAGEKVCVTTGRSGTTRCGTVTVANTALTYASPGLAARKVSNLVKVSGVCVQPGDSGAPVYAGGSFVGIAVAKAASGCAFWYTRADVAFAQLGIKLG